MERKFDIRFLLLAVSVNGGAVFFINLQEGGASGATSSGIVQLFVSAALAGFTVPYAKRQAFRNDAISAYFFGGIVMASFVASCGLLLHWVFHTPDLLGTAIWNFSINATGGTFLVLMKRTHHVFPASFSRFIDRL